MEITESKAAVVLSLLLAVVVAPTMSSPMPAGLRYGISAGFVVTLLLAFAVGVKYGEYRANNVETAYNKP